MHLHIASFRAVSSAGQVEGESLDDQLLRNKEFIAEFSRYYPGYAATLSHEFEVTESRSITLLSDACNDIPAYRRLVELIQSPKNKRKLDALVFQSWDRLARSPALITTLNELMLKNGIVPISRHNLPRTLNCEELLNDFGAGVSTAIDAQRSGNEVRELVRRNRMGMPKRLREKKLFPSHPNYGYRIVDGRIVDVPAEQAVVRLALLELYADKGLSATAVAKELNDRKIPSSAGARWHANSIRYLLARLPIYRGKLLLNQVSKTGRQFMEVDGIHNPVFSEEEASRIESAIQLHRHERRVSIHAPYFGIVYCRDCNHKMHVYTSNIYKEDKKHSRYRMTCGKCGITIGCLKLLAAVEAAAARLDSVDNLADLVPERPNTAETEQRRTQLSADLSAVESERSRLVRGYVAGDIPENLFTAMSKEIASRESILLAELVKLGDQAKLDQERQLAIDRLFAAKRDAKDRLQQLRNEEDTQEVRAWLFSFLRLYVNKVGTQNFVTRIEYV